MCAHSRIRSVPVTGGAGGGGASAAEKISHSRAAPARPSPIKKTTSRVTQGTALRAVSAAPCGSDSLDPDMLDEQTRALLNFTRPDELVILEAPANRR